MIDNFLSILKTMTVEPRSTLWGEVPNGYNAVCVVLLGLKSHQGILKQCMILKLLS